MQQVTPQKIERDLLKILKNHEDIAIELITDKQLFEGINAQGDELPEYSVTSVVVFGKPPGNWRLFETGEFYNSITMDASGFPVIFESTDPKRDDIFTHLDAKGSDPDEVLGLTRENLRELARTYLREKTAGYFRRLLQL